MTVTPAYPALLTVLLLANGGPDAPAAAKAPGFAPDAWFRGVMHSSGTLAFVGGKPSGLHVDSLGRRSPDGSVRLDQAIHWGDGRTDHCFWVMRRRSEGGFEVTLTDATGPVAFEVQGARAHLKYRMRSRAPLTMEQWLDLQPDGRTLENRGVVRLLGLPVARLKETIVHDPF